MVYKCSMKPIFIITKYIIYREQIELNVTEQWVGKQLLANRLHEGKLSERNPCSLSGSGSSCVNGVDEAWGWLSHSGAAWAGRPGPASSPPRAKLPEDVLLPFALKKAPRTKNHWIPCPVLSGSPPGSDCLCFSDTCMDKWAADLTRRETYRCTRGSCWMGWHTLEATQGPSLCGPEALARNRCGHVHLPDYIF